MFRKNQRYYKLKHKKNGSNREVTNTKKHKLEEKKDFYKQTKTVWVNQTKKNINQRYFPSTLRVL